MGSGTGEVATAVSPVAHDGKAMNDNIYCPRFRRISHPHWYALLGALYLQDQQRGAAS